MKDAKCAWKKKSQSGHCNAGGAINVFQGPDPQDSALQIMVDASTPVDGFSPEVSYVQCHTATPHVCEDLPSSTAEPAKGPPQAGQPTFDEFDGRNRQNCAGCLQYRKLAMCGMGIAPPPTNSPGKAHTQQKFDPNRRPCLCSPYMPPTGDGTGWDGTFDFNHKPTQDDNDDCCGNDTMWFAGGGSCIIPSDPNKNTASQVEDACNQKNTCAWSKTTKTCVHKSCARRTNSHDCQTAFQGSDTSRNIPQCLWIGESGGAGRCIEGNCYNRCNANDCTTPIQDNRHSVHGPCMWVDNVENDILESSQCKTANLLAQQQDGGGAPQPGVCMPLECTHRGDFQPRN